MKMTVMVGNPNTGVTEVEAAKGRQDLAGYLANWWSSVSQGAALPVQKIDVKWGAIECQLQLAMDEARSPQILLKGEQSAPRSVQEVVGRFLTDTCRVAKAEDHFQIDIQKRLMDSMINKTSQRVDTSTLNQLSMFAVRKPRPLSVSQAMPESPADVNTPKPK